MSVEPEKKDELKETGDYPFKTWDTYFNALNESLQTEFYDETYPKYYKILQDYNDIDIIEHMFNKYKLDADIGLYNYIYSLCFTGIRYSKDAYDRNIIDFFLSKKAEFPLDLLFNGNEDIDDIEEECNSYEIRAIILDNFVKELNLDVSDYANWTEIKAEDISEQTITYSDLKNEDYYDLVRFKHLKSITKCLRKL